MTLAAQINETPLRSWSEFIDTIEELPAWIFRGQLSANWPLMSSLERQTPAGYPRQFAEHDLTREFQRRARTYLQAHEVPDKHGEWMALTLRLGHPTRSVLTLSPQGTAPTPTLRRAS
jgi:hypothetical protein